MPSVFCRGRIGACACFAASGLVAWLALAPAARAQSPTARPKPLVAEGATVQISDHAHVILDDNVPLVPNVGIIVGSRATLVVDTGLGEVNARIILREVEKVSRNTELYVVSTHYHAEHAIGEAAFPASATVVRARAQQRDIDELGAGSVERFRGFSPLAAELLAGARYADADVLFDREHAIDLGGVRVRLLALGPMHTRGDTMVFVEEDGVLLAGDVVMNHRFLVPVEPASSISAWRGVLDEVALLRPRQIVPSHGALGDGSLIDLQRACLELLETRVRAHKAAGRTADETVELTVSEIRAAYPDWSGERWIEPAARVAFREAP